MSDGGWRFVTWNVDWWRRRPQQVPRADFIAGFDADVVALQELSGAEAKVLRRSHRGPSIFSHEEYEPATWGWMGCGLLLRDGVEVLHQGVVLGLPKPQRSLWARIRMPGDDEVTVVSWHAPNAAGDGVGVKMAAYRAMSAWLAEQGPVVLGADLNTWSDRLDLQAPVEGDPFFHEHAFVGVNPAHGLLDAYRCVRAADGQMDGLRADRPEGPLAVSHVLDGGAEHRMDRVYCSDSLVPMAAGYELEASYRAGSDHALHWVDFV